MDERTLLLKNAIVGWHALTSVEIVEAHPEVRRHLGTCPNLRELCVYVPMDLNWLPAESPGFEIGLEELTICAFEGRYLSAVVKCMSSLPIIVEEFEVQCGKDDIPAKLRNLEVIAEALAPTSLREFCYYDYIFDAREDAQPISIGVLLRYQQFGNSTLCYIECLSLSGAWPDYHPLYPTVTLSPLKTLARLYPKPNFFECRLRSMEVPPLPNVPTMTPEHNSPYITLDFDPLTMNLTTENVQEMAAYICTVLKDRERTLETHEELSYDEEARMARWRELQALVEGLD